MDNRPPNDEDRAKFIKKLAQNTDADPRNLDVSISLQVGRIDFAKLFKDEPETPAIKALRESDLVAVIRADLARLQADSRKLAAVRGLPPGWTITHDPFNREFELCGPPRKDDTCECYTGDFDSICEQLAKLIGEAE